jgi:thioredoxin reductase (NADPH)
MSYWIVYLAAFVLITALYLRRQRRIAREHARQLEQSLEAGLMEPPSLHPVINPLVCLGSSSCVRVCPEGALGIIDGKAVLINGAACIGHGACRAACPVDAIELVFGTEKRGIDIPNVTPEFETNVQGIFIAGELGGMGLIRKAAEQGRQAVDVIAKRKNSAAGSFEYELVIVGCGPAGLSAGLAAIQHKLSYKLIEQEESLGGAVFHYPRNKIAMTAPVKLALIGKVRFAEVQKEKLLEFWQGVVAKTGLAIAFRECMTAIVQQDGGFVVNTSRGSYSARCVLLTMGRRGTPRKLDVPGEETPKVVYRLIDAEQYDGQAVLVVGGGDGALEAAIALAERPGTTVTLSYRSEAFSRVKQKNRMRLEQLQRDGRLRTEMKSSVEAIEAASIRLATASGSREIANDAVIVCAGGQLPTPLLQQIGIEFETKFGSA